MNTLGDNVCMDICKNEISEYIFKPNNFKKVSSPLSKTYIVK